MKSGGNYNSSRRNFFKILGSTVLIVPFLDACKEKVVTFLIRLSGTNHILGHKLRVKNFPKPSKQIQIPYLIVGGGITGLSAARQFVKKGISDFLLVELENHLGGNSSNSQNKYSKYPLGAHYLPLPNLEDKELLKFLEEENIILGYDEKGFPNFDELQLTFAPDERLFYKNNWQEGIVPREGNSTAENIELNRFFKMMEDFRSKKDATGLYWFMIPMQLSSKEPELKELDNLTMKEWLQKQNFTSKPLYTYVDYCCRDDFGLGIEFVSAYAGIHYFAARKQNSSHEKTETVLTWPEGNARLAHHLKKYSTEKTLKNHLVYEVKIKNDKAVALVFDDKTKTSIEIIADKIIMATPQFVNQYLVEDRKQFTKNFHYAPWLLATLVVSDLTDNYSFPLSWDNVAHGSKGLGYIYNQHQSLQQVQDKKVITYYYSFSSSDCGKSRREIYKKPKEYWKNLVINDLKISHPNIEEVTESIDIHILGHGMISPKIGFLFSESKHKASKSIADKIFFAHSDLSGISIFEEAFHQGINIVNKVILL
ncbi:NAD(P)/FAD-dependent oxidoreductase [Flavobacterium croceum]|uniref:NAD(P)/FAD-dependent oxidoreductase n=1 Tax=Flavobacterium croceum TaxID=370975 RepID=UPI0024A8D57A|nr:NAD(P)/FAD-dependent oxidoreductase [Flavobacterium croceum]